MINLLPLENQKEIRNLYRAHVTIITLWLIFFVTLLSLVMLIPSYIIFAGQSEESAALLAKEEGTDIAKQTEGAIASLRQTEEKIERLKHQHSYTLSGTLAHLAQEKTAGITLRRIEHSRGSTILISGTALSRESMNTYVKALQADPLFSKVDSPISNLLGSKNIQFSIVLTLR